MASLALVSIICLDRIGLVSAIADQLPDIRQAAEPRRLRHGWINGIKELQVDYAP